jgi:hypothetical protein
MKATPYSSKKRWLDDEPNSSSCRISSGRGVAARGNCQRVIRRRRENEKKNKIKGKKMMMV